jgi:FlaA1/EpsC-like NDP-sugar epimerase
MRLPRWLFRSGRTQRPTDISALLGRPSVNLDTPELQRFVAGRRILVTGSGGSIGSELCRQLMRFCPRSLVMVERAEPALFSIDHELRGRWIGAELIPLIGDITDARRIDRIFRQQKPEIVFHAAAHKHVPLMECNAGEAIRNNVLGTQVVVEASRQTGVDAFVLISTDKAVNPTSVMGASKRVAEMITLSSNGPGRFVAVRFGNVIGSSGSVIPIFQKQIEAGGPVTVTHADMRRYFMTIPEASQLVMQAAAIGQGGELFVLDMGQPVRILDLANRMIAAAGLRAGRDIDIRITGLRPGEKLFEELSYDDERTLTTPHQQIRIWKSKPVEPRKVAHIVQRLGDVVEADDRTVRLALTDALSDETGTVSLRLAA